jgi:hypothetical protein
MNQLPELAIANLRLLGSFESLRQVPIFLVFDCMEKELDQRVSKAVEESRKDTNLSLLFYSPRQVKIARKIAWGWVYAWMSWTIGISKARTRHVILHDLDALPLSETIFEDCYQNCLESKARFQGIQTYHQNGVTTDMQLATTFELVIDAQYLRKNFRPIDVFNRVAIIGGRYVDFDTFLYAQWRSESVNVTTIDESQLFHPSQMICQFTDFMAGRNTLETVQHNLLALVYMQYLGGDTQCLANIQSDLETESLGYVVFNERKLNINHINQAQWAWLEKQIRRLEQTLYSRTRPEVAPFLDQLALRAGTDRTVGSEDLSEGGVADY